MGSQNELHKEYMHTYLQYRNQSKATAAHELVFQMTPWQGWSQGTPTQWLHGKGARSWAGQGRSSSSHPPPGHSKHWDCSGFHPPNAQAHKHSPAFVHFEEMWRIWFLSTKAWLGSIQLCWVLLWKEDSVALKLHYWAVLRSFQK